MNFLKGEITDGGKAFKFGNTTMSLDGYDGGKLTDGTAILGVRPEYTTVDTTGIAGKTLEAVVDLDEPMGSDSLLWLTAEGQAMSVRIKAEDIVDKKTVVHLKFDMTKASLFDVNTEQRI